MLKVERKGSIKPREKLVGINCIRANGKGYSLSELADSRFDEKEISCCLRTTLSYGLADPIKQTWKIV